MDFNVAASTAPVTGKPCDFWKYLTPRMVAAL